MKVWDYRKEKGKEYARRAAEFMRRVGDLKSSKPLYLDGIKLEVAKMFGVSKRTIERDLKRSE